MQRKTNGLVYNFQPIPSDTTGQFLSILNFNKASFINNSFTSKMNYKFEVLSTFPKQGYTDPGTAGHPYYSALIYSIYYTVCHRTVC